MEEWRPTTNKRSMPVYIRKFEVSIIENDTSANGEPISKVDVKFGNEGEGRHGFTGTYNVKELTEAQILNIVKVALENGLNLTDKQEIKAFPQPYEGKSMGKFRRTPDGKWERIEE